MRSLSVSSASSLTPLRPAALNGRRSESKNGLGGFADQAFGVRTAASTAIAYSGILRGSAMAKPSASDVMVDRVAGAANVYVVRQEDNQVGLGQLASLVSISREAGPVSRVLLMT